MIGRLSSLARAFIPPRVSKISNCRLSIAPSTHRGEAVRRGNRLRYNFVYPYCDFMRRDLARSSVTVRPGVSSINIFAAASCEAAEVSLGKSRSDRNPFLTFCRSTCALEQRSLWTSCWLLISRLKTATGLPAFIETCSAMFIANAVFPMLGRAAMTIISAG